MPQSCRFAVTSVSYFVCACVWCVSISWSLFEKKKKKERNRFTREANIIRGRSQIERHRLEIWFNKEKRKRENLSNITFSNISFFKIERCAYCVKRDVNAAPLDTSNIVDWKLLSVPRAETSFAARQNFLRRLTIEEKFSTIPQDFVWNSRFLEKFSVR